MGKRDQVVVAADGTISVEDVDTFDEPQVSAIGVLSVVTREAAEVDRLSSDGFTLTTGVGAPAFQRLPLESRIAVLGNSKNIATGIVSQTDMMLAQLGGRFRVPVGGQQSLGGQLYSEYVDQVPYVAAVLPHVVFVGDATNDITGGANGATTISRLDTILSALRAINPPPMIVLEKTGHTSGNANDSIDAINAYIDSLAAADPLGVFVADTDTGINLGSTTISPDGIHNSPLGAWTKAERCATALADLISTDTWWPTAGAQLSGNLNTAWDMAGTGGTLGANVTGSVATGYTAANASGATVVASKGTLNGDACQVLTISGTASSNTGDITISRTQSTSFVEGGVYELAFEYEVTAGDGVSAPANLYGFGATLNRQFQTAENWQNKAGSATYGAGAVGAQTIMRGIARTQNRYYVSSSGTANMQLEIGLRLLTTGASDVLVKIGRIFWRRAETEAYAPPYCHIGNPLGTVTAPFLTGGTTVGSVLTVSTLGIGAWSGGALVFTYQWTKDGVDIPGATSRTFTTVAAGVHRCRVIATNGLGSASGLSSNSITIT